MSLTLTGVGVDWDPATTQWLAQLSTRPTFTTVFAVNTFIRQCKADGNWSLLDRFWLFAQDIRVNAKVSIANPSSTQITEQTNGGTLTWTANQGYTGDGTNSYLDSGFNPTTNGVNFTLNSGSFGIYSRTNSAINAVEIGVVTNPPLTRSILLSKFTDNNNYIKVNDDTYTVTAVADSLALISAVRDTSNHQASYQRGSFLSGTNVATTGLPNANFYMLAQNSAGTPANFSTRQVAIAFAGSGAITQSTFYTAVQNLATSLGFNV